MTPWLLPLAVASFGLVALILRDPRPRRTPLTRLRLPRERVTTFTRSQR
jgi:hypothetical protein